MNSHRVGLQLVRQQCETLAVTTVTRAKARVDARGVERALKRIGAKRMSTGALNAGALVPETLKLLDGQLGAPRLSPRA